MSVFSGRAASAESMNRAPASWRIFAMEGKPRSLPEPGGIASGSLPDPASATRRPDPLSDEIDRIGALGSLAAKDQRMRDVERSLPGSTPGAVLIPGQGPVGRDEGGRDLASGSRRDRDLERRIMIPGGDFCRNDEQTFDYRKIIASASPVNRRFCQNWGELGQEYVQLTFA